MGVAVAVADAEGVIWLPYAPGRGEVSRLNQATAIAGTLTDGGVPQLVKVVMMFPTPAASVTTRDVTRREVLSEVTRELVSNHNCMSRLTVLSARARFASVPRSG